MQTFLIQTINGRIRHDFSFALLEAIDYQNWYYDEKRFDYIAAKTPNKENCIPVGTVEFVLSYLQKYYGIETVKPINIPSELMKPEFLKRKVQIIETDKTAFPLTHKPLFIKDNTKIKGFCDVVRDPSQLKGEFLVSELIDIDSEWRAFVYQHQLVGIQNYAGEFTLFPDIPLIEKMVQSYRHSPPAYTLDVGIHPKKGTFVIEVHNFFSCGLYGFNDSRILPQMFIRSFQSMIPKS